MDRRRSIKTVISAITAAASMPLSSRAWAEAGDGTRLLPTLKDIELLAPGWFDEVRSEGAGRGSAFRVFRGWRTVRGAPQGEPASVLLSITIRPRPEPTAQWGPTAWQGDFEQKRTLIRQIPDLQAREIDLASFAYLVTWSSGSHVEVTFYTEDWKVTVHNGTGEARLSYPAEAQALQIARWLLIRLDHE
jgi:hypothetical protein